MIGDIISGAKLHRRANNHLPGPLGWLCLALLTGCGSTATARPPAPIEPERALGAPPVEVCLVNPDPELKQPLQLIAPEERVPEFLLARQDCQIYDSRELVGKKPFVVVFFASWCTVCEHKMPLVRAALGAREEKLTSVFVSLDDAEAWAETEAFLGRHGVAPASAVAGRDFLGFSLGYNPFRSVPVVVIVGRSGRVVDVQVGVREGDDTRLPRALDAAIEESPEPGAALTSFRPR